MTASTERLDWESNSDDNVSAPKVFPVADNRRRIITMATLETRKNRNGTNIKIRFFLGNERKTLCLGSKYTRRQAVEIAGQAEKIAHAIVTGGRFSRSTTGFISDMTPDLRQRFMACGLLDAPDILTCRDLWDRYTAETSFGRKESTLKTYTTVRKRFFDFFPEKTDFRKITRRDVERWKEFLIKKGYAEASVCGSLQRANSVFYWAVENDYLEKNPFRGVKRGSFVNRNRDFYVSMKWYEKLLDACPDQTWRTLLALCRIGGLRNPSETLRLTWGDVDWANQSILVHSPKTEHHTGKATRLIPMFPELKEQLKLQWEQAEEGGSPYVIDRWRGTESAMRTHFRRIVFRAGLPEWDRLFQNLRASRATDICNEYPAYVEAQWIGHSEKIAEAHYLQVTDDHFQRALKPKCPQTQNGDKNGDSTACFQHGQTAPEPAPF